MMKPPYHPTHNLVTVANTLLARFQTSHTHPPIPELLPMLQSKKKIACLLFDGMGEAILARHLKPEAYLTRQQFIPITSTFPSTTAAATNAFLSGRYPGDIGWLGWAHYFKEYDQMIELFTGNDYFTQASAIDPRLIRSILPYTSIFEKIQAQNPTLTVAHVWPMIRPDGAKTLDEWSYRISETLSSSPDVCLYGYWLEPDKSLHTLGVNHPSISAIIQTIDHTIESLTKKHPDTIFLVFADHGLVDTTFLSIQEHDDLWNCLQRSFALEPRAAAFYVKPEKHDEFQNLFHTYYHKYFHLFTKQEVHHMNLYGPGPVHQRFDDFIGDFVAVSYGHWSFSHGVPIGEKPLNFVAHHAGMHPDEMNIRLYVLNR